MKKKKKKKKMKDKIKIKNNLRIWNLQKKYNS